MCYLCSACLTQDVDLSRVVPLCVHADDAESHRRRSFCVATVSSVLVGGTSPWDVRLLLYVTNNQDCLDETFDTLDTWLTWSLTELANGKWFGHDPWGNVIPSRQDIAGKPIAAGWRGVLVLHKGDAKYLQRAYHTHNSWVSDRVCWHRRATRAGNLCYTLHGKFAPHRQTMVPDLVGVFFVCFPPVVTPPC